MINNTTTWSNSYKYGSGVAIKWRCWSDAKTNRTYGRARARVWRDGNYARIFLSNYLRQSLGQQTLNFDISLAQVKINDKLTIRLDIFSILADGSNYEAILQFHRFHYSEYLVHIHNWFFQSIKFITTICYFYRSSLIWFIHLNIISWLRRCGFSSGRTKRRNVNQPRLVNVQLNVPTNGSANNKSSRRSSVKQKQTERKRV